MAIIDFASAGKTSQRVRPRGADGATRLGRGRWEPPRLVALGGTVCRPERAAAASAGRGGRAEGGARAMAGPAEGSTDDQAVGKQHKKFHQAWPPDVAAQR
jgi:hypothetical protein